MILNVRTRLRRLLEVMAMIPLVALLGGTGISADEGDSPNWFEIAVVDSETGRGIPLVELRTTDGVRYVTDSAGRVAIWEPGLMGTGTRVYFHVESHGYHLAAGGTVRPEGGFRPKCRQWLACFQ